MGEPLEERKMQNRAGGVRMDAWTYPGRRVFFLNGYVDSVVALSDTDE